MATTRKKPTAAQLAARAAFAAKAKAGAFKRKANPKAKAPPARRAAPKVNQVTRGTKTTTRRSLVGSTTYCVLFYAGKDKPTGKPDMVFPARDKPHAESFIEQLGARGASGVAIIEKTVNRV